MIGYESVVRPTLPGKTLAPSKDPGRPFDDRLAQAARWLARTPASFSQASPLGLMSLCFKNPV